MNIQHSHLRVRFAPSPTGYLHVGGARTALYCYLVARKYHGTFVLRIEDTDTERSTEESMRQQIKDLTWLGLSWDEGPHPLTFNDQGDFGPYRQSHRSEIYQKFADQLLESGQAYYCFLSDEEKEDQNIHHHQFTSPFRDLPLVEAKRRLAKGEKATIRFKTPLEKREYVLKDLIRGEVVFPSDMVSDFVLIRSSGMPVYNYCCVIDDALMKITHVLRAEEHLSNTVRQLMIYEALGFPLPQFGHLSIILGPDKQKLSKRHGATSCHEYQLRGFLPEALNNFMALLGWSSPLGQEILSMEEMVEQMSLDRFHSSPAVFDETKLKWVNASHLRNLSHRDLWQRLLPFLHEAGLHFNQDESWQNRALDLMKSYMETLADGVNLFRPLAQGKWEIGAESQETLQWESSLRVVKQWLEILQEGDSKDKEYLTETDFLQAQEKVKQTCNVKGKHLFMPIRVAVLGQPHGAELKIVVPLISRQELIFRAHKVKAEMEG